ncbi:MAG: uncharacterized protein QOF30_801, partial [Acidimicrobiaceae bacterium]|nr:uncharacterized protein [Acidimicrobiaceae bacterium]
MSGGGLVDAVSGFVGELRAAGLPVSMTEHLDAMEAVGQIPLEDRVAFKYALGSTLVKNAAHWRAFETIFDVYFSPVTFNRVSMDESELGGDHQLALATELLDAERREGDAEMAALSAEELLELLYRALLDGDEELLAALARQAVDRFAGMEPGRPVGGTYYLYRTLRHLDLDGVRTRLMTAAAAAGVGVGVGGGRQDTEDGTMSELEERLAQEEFDARIGRLRHLIESEIRRRLVADRGAQAMAK